MLKNKVVSTAMFKDKSQRDGLVANDRIRLVKGRDINRKRWDACISSSFNSIVYTYSWYLDLVCERWDALVEGDYVSVMPLPRNKKHFINYVYQPIFCQQLGVFSSMKLDSERINRFLTVLSSNFLFADLNLNTFNYQPKLAFESTDRVTYQLELSNDYHSLYSSYQLNTRRNIRKSQRSGLIVETRQTADQFCSFIFSCWDAKPAYIPVKSRANLERIVRVGLDYGFVDLLVATMDGQVCAGLAVLKSGYKMILLVAASNERARECSAMFALVDHVVRMNSENPLVFDFEGSMVPDIAFFFKGFGASPAYYQRVVINKLPFGLKR